ncbi:MAG: hypothetical protein QOC92_4634, partial [Acidimicrobiaceae bacterium]
MTGPWVSGWAKARTAVLALVAVIALTALELARQPGTRSWQSMWAEDGTVYGTDAFALSLPSTILRGYAGYVQVVPRVLALAVPAVPVTRVAAVFAFEASLVTALLAVSVYRCSEGWIDHRGLRTVVAAMTALVPIAYLETSTNIANLGWPLLVASGWALVSRRDQLVDTVLRIVVVVATALSTTLAALFWPAAVAVAVRRRQRRDWAVFAALSVGLGLQFVLDRF